MDLSIRGERDVHDCIPSSKHTSDNVGRRSIAAIVSTGWCVYFSGTVWRRISSWHCSCKYLARFKRSWLFEEMVEIAKLSMPIVSRSLNTWHIPVCIILTLFLQILVYFFQSLLFFISVLLIGHSAGHSKTELDAAGMYLQCSYLYSWIVRQYIYVMSKHFICHVYYYYFYMTSMIIVLFVVDFQL